jgi:hypothetical protein
LNTASQKKRLPIKKGVNPHWLIPKNPSEPGSSTLRSHGTSRGFDLPMGFETNI